MSFGIQLTLHLIEATLPFFHTIFFGKYTELEKGKRARKARQGRKAIKRVLGKIWFNDEKTVLTEEEKDLTRRRLEDIASRIYFKVGTVKGACYIQRLLSPKDSVVIGIDEYFCAALEKAHKSLQTSEPCDAALYAYLQVDFASALGHELAHAMKILTHGKDYAYFGNNPVAEEGLEWQHRALGGFIRTVENYNRPNYYVDGAVSGINGMIVIEDIPNARSVKQYAAKGAPLAIRQDLPTPPSVHILWNTSIVHFIKLCQTSFWQNEFVEKGLTAVQFPKNTGGRMLVKDDGSEQYYEVDENDPGNLAPLPKGYVLIQKLVTKIPWT
ncbi:hypothetical protein LTR08_003885 [Meristemomyces frigidus]|nr:hypothetical protein LTR08_003885 [Meristemomyces frigidus]